jgi:hypothetical protein
MPWKTDDVKRLIELEAQLRGIDPRLALALAEQESGFDPQARSPKGATGIFQLMPATARQLKVDPSDVAQNISGGLDYLKQQLDAFGGDPGMAVAAYNAGPGVVKAYGKVPPYKETRGLVSRVLGSLGPASAEAATPQAQPQAVNGMTRLQELEAHLARLEGQAAPQAPQAQAPTAQAQAQAPAEEPITPERRFLDLPSSQQMSLEERTQAFKDFYGLSQQLKEEFLRSEEPASDLTVEIEKPSAPAERQARIREELAAWEKQAGRPWREGDPRMPSEARLGVPDEAPLEEGITRPSTMIPLIMGVGIPGLTTAAPGMAAAERLVGKAGPLITRGARAIGEGVSQTLGWTAGRTIETGEVPSPGEIGTEAALNIGAGGVLETLSAGTRAVLRRSRAGKAIAQADEATEAASRQWQQEVQTARQAQQQGQAEIYDRALEKATQAQREYQAARLRRDDIIATNQQEYDFAVRSQGEALTSARQVPGNYRPETPSWLLYEKFGDAAKDAAVDLAPARTALAEVRASRGVLPDGTVRPFPSQVESMAAHLEKATGETSIKTIRDELRRLGPLTRHADGNIRGPAKQLYGIYADALETSPVANDLLRQANATFRKEMALQDVQEWLRPGHGIVRIDNQGRETINVGALMTRLEKHIGDDTFFAKSFTPDELQAMRHDVGRLAGTPTMPRTPPRVPREVSPPDLELLPGGAGTMRRPPELPPQPGATRPTVERPRIFPRGSEWASQAGKWGGLLYVLDQIGVSPKTVAALKVATVTQQQGSWLLAKALLTPRLRPLLEAGMAGNGQIHQGTYKAIMAAMNAREKSQMERETRGKR